MAWQFHHGYCFLSLIIIAIETLRRETTSTVTRWVLEKRGNTHKTTMLGACVPPDLTGVHRSSSRSVLQISTTLERKLNVISEH
ncbi:9723_t:CDS:2 [Funneliformis mosseae]|uniref:9723_t:CDS:1 n=1 Tax=Funneliformis mosseae TaxID=27381 RepID=A0A9N8W9J5_FUNMO|nr:9723_t:CDS:2 [Funneliformis mosseae]